jgi:hypothetical protein
MVITFNLHKHVMISLGKMKCGRESYLGITGMNLGWIKYLRS